MEARIREEMFNLGILSNKRGYIYIIEAVKRFGNFKMCIRDRFKPALLFFRRQIMSLTGFLSYSRVNWQQSPSKSTPWNATNLNIMDAGIKNNNDMISNLRDEVTQLNSNIDVKNSFCKNIASVDGTWEG